MAAAVKPGDPDFVPRYPPLDLAPIEQRIRERDAIVGSFTNAVAEAVRADTEMMRELLREVRNLRMANQGLKEILASMRGTRT